MRIVLLSACWVLIAGTAPAGLIAENFDTTSGTNTTYNSATFYGNAQVPDSELRLTGVFDFGAQGAAVFNDADPGMTVQSFTASFTYGAAAFFRGGAADGISFSFGDVNSGLPTQDAETGYAGRVLSLGMPLYPFSSTTPGFYLRANQTVVASETSKDPYTGTIGQDERRFTVNMSYNLGLVSASVTDGSATTQLFTNVDVSSFFTPAAGDRFAFAARTGGAAAEQRVDNVLISTVAVPEPAAMSVFAFSLALCRLASQRRTRR